MYLVIDIGGTHLRIGVSEDRETLGEHIKIRTPQSYQEILDLIKKTAAELTKGKAITASAVGVAGPINADRSAVVFSGNLPGFKDKPLKKDLEELLNTRVILENDAGLGGLGEATRGKGKDFSIVAFLTVSTGLGGVRVVDGKIDKNFLGFEPGYQIISTDGKTYLESLVSGTAVYQQTGQKPPDIDDPEVWDNQARLLAIGLNNVAVFWSPEIIVLGGALMEKIPLEKLREYFRKTVTVFDTLPKIEKAELGDEVTLFGALEYLKQTF